MLTVMIITITISVLAVSAIGIELVDGECQPNHEPIKSCCCLGYKNTYFNVKRPGVYTIGNFAGVKCSNTRAYCDTATDGGGWLVIQRRKDGRVDFSRNWEDYKVGFGSLHGEFWFGLHGIHTVTNQGQWELRIDYTFPNGTKGFLSYSSFKVGPATAQYPLIISGFSGITDDPFLRDSLNGTKFSTYDRDNDSWGSNCAATYGNGGWWFRTCSAIRLNHKYNHRHTIYLNREDYALPFVEIKIRPKECDI